MLPQDCGSNGCMRLEHAFMIGAALFLCVAVRGVRADGAVRVVISEVAWAGSDRSANDEWIELAALGDGAAQSLSGWVVTSLRSSGQEDVVVRFGSGHVLASGEWGIVARLPPESSRLAITPMLIASTLSLPNSKLLLRLKNERGETVDTVDDGSGSPFAGANPSGGIGRASMERVDVTRPGDDGENWRTATETAGFREGPAIFGTPGLPPTPLPEPAPELNAPVLAASASGACLESAPPILIQSGTARADEAVSINVTAPDDDRITSCAWTFGDGFTADTCNPRSHRYASVGSYQMILTVRDSCGHSFESALPIEVRAQGKSQRYPSCIPESFTGVVISEVLPRPGSEGGEWIELYNASGKERRLCGWSLDDDDGGSSPFALEGLSIGDQAWLVLDRNVTGLTLNDDRDSVRLIGPDGSVVDLVDYDHAQSGHSIARRDDGNMLWTPDATPGSANRFRDPERLTGGPPACLSAALPAPLSGSAAWVELSNCSGRPQLLQGFALAAITRAGALGEQRMPLPPGFALRRADVLRFTEEDLGFTLPDHDAGVALLDQQDSVVTVLSWERASRGDIVLPPEGPTVLVAVSGIDEAGGMQCSMLAVGDSAPALGAHTVVRPRGIKLPQDSALHAAALEYLRSALAGRSALVRFSQHWQDRDGVYIGDILADDGSCVACELLRRGLAMVDPLSMSDIDLQSYEAEAKRELRGVWALSQTLLEQDDRRAAQAFLSDITRDPGVISVAPKPGLLASGSILTVHSRVPGALFIAVNSGGYTLSSGVLRINENMMLRAYVDVPIPGTQLTVRSGVWQGQYLAALPTNDRIEITEVQPRSVDGFPEWVELTNVGDEIADLAGWKIDDIAPGGSRPWTIPMGFSLKPKERLVLTKDQTHVTLNDDGDAVTLVRPDGSIADVVDVPKLPKATSWSRFGARWCVTTMATPGEKNRCVEPKNIMTKKRSTPKLRSAKAAVALVTPRFPAFRQSIFGLQKDSASILNKNFVLLCLGLSCATQIMAWRLLAKPR